jgi:hypothetical protein
VTDLSHLPYGYHLAYLALVLVCAYFALVAPAPRLCVRRKVLVPRYEPPRGISPAVTAWLFENGKLPRALAAAVVNMAAKGFLKLEQTRDLYSITRLGPEVSPSLEPEEDALARTLFKGYDCFDFDEPSPELRAALRAFRWALRDTTYFSRHTALFVFPWLVSGIGIGCALIQGKYHVVFRGYEEGLIVVAFGCLVVAVRTLPDSFEKAISRLSGRTTPVRPWNYADNMTLTLFAGGLGGICALGLLSTTQAALLTAAFVAVNALFYYSLQGPTPTGRKAMDELAGYRKFLVEVDTDAISRMNDPETVPANLNQKHAYALAFHVDLGWGEQFVTSIAELIESSQVLGKLWRASESDQN